MFEEGESLWDFHRGRELDVADKASATEIGVLKKMSRLLRQSKWRPSSRANYNAWFRTWLEFCKVNGYRPMPAKPESIFMFLTWITMYYAVGTVMMAYSALVAIHRLNGHKNPVRHSLAVEDMLKAVSQVGIVGSRMPKCIVDTSFMLKVVEWFVDKYPVFDRKVFDPKVAGRGFIEMRGVGLMVVGIELGVRPSSLVALTLCCWQQRRDNTVGVQVALMKNGKNGEVFCPVLDYMKGSFAENGSAISFMNEYLLPWIDEFGPEFNLKRCTKKSHRTAHCLHCPKLFPVLGGEGRSNKAVRVDEVSDVVKRWAVRIGRDKAKYSAVSLRRGSTSIAAAKGVSKKIRQSHGGWKSKRMLQVYTELSTSKEKAVSKAIHRAMKKSRECKAKKVQFRI